MFSLLFSYYLSSLRSYSDTEAIASYGFCDWHYEWSFDQTCRSEFGKLLSVSGLKCVSRLKSVELSGPREMEFPPMDLSTVNGTRVTFTVSVPKAEPAKKRRKLLQAAATNEENTEAE